MPPEMMNLTRHAFGELKFQINHLLKKSNLIVVKKTIISRKNDVNSLNGLDLICGAMNGAMELMS